MSPALIAVLPFVGALLPGWLIRWGRDVAAVSCAAASLVALLGLCLHIPAIMAGEVVTARFA
ncbi:multicomponent K+:H+ antiporter subunit A [Paracoccus aminovorans]|uniref:Multicomponent K+:H+ antiporter subunit A n=1 Tax=Paracoccus aminovorans TaxID=34004 RepID=A0A1I2ZKV3_9RHOB|nr:multicomponent Na+/H+ antiporter antiporter [Paracoccus aminovorans]SFH38099.1 multicomponent K+:H+ antiporter subunit A [Paracoccus aminovorans]